MYVTVVSKKFQLFVLGGIIILGLFFPMEVSSPKLFKK